jgi:uncharacterized protein (TIGR03083 family)
MVDAEVWIRALRGSHDRFVAIVSELDGAAIRRPSYADEWSIAQVASHLGSQAEIFGLFLDAGLADSAAPGVERFRPIWEVWDGRAPEDQVTESVRANEQFVRRLEGLSGPERAGFSLSLFGADRDLAGLVDIRLREHALHTWDIAVAVDPTAVVRADSVDLLVDSLPEIAGRAGTAVDDARTLGVETVDPERSFVLTTGPAVSLAAGAAPVELRLPAEAFVRLVFGRLDPAHSPEGPAEDVTLATLRQVFTGF